MSIRMFAVLAASVTVFVAASLCVAAQAASPAPSPAPLSGLGVILRIESSAPNPLFDVDGYRVRLEPTTPPSFFGPLKTLADVKPGTWMRFEGKLDDAGVFVASSARFYPPGFRAGLTAMGPRKPAKAADYQHITSDALLDSDGRLVDPHTKFRLRDMAGPCGWHRVPGDTALQQRVERVGMRLVPDYQKRLEPDDPSRIPFRFYAMADNPLRGVFACNAGLIFLPRNVIARLQNDDQLAAALAEAVAFELQQQLAAFTTEDGVRLGADAAAAWLTGGAALWASDEIAEHVIAAKFERQRARIALQLLANAGFDPWQAPVASRLLAPKDPPADPSRLKDTHDSLERTAILKAQYAQPAATQ